MALSDDKLWDLWNAQGTDDMSCAEAFVFARAIETEVRKQDTELIRQMHDAMSNLTTLCMSGGSPLFMTEFDRLIEATTAARARLGEKP
jgi:pyruvate-formate lyase-activating enzyme